jgi:pimeloyl-ACP methyl ester carboxylesterase
LIASATALAVPPVAPALTETVVTEPVFNGKARVFTAGPVAAPTVVLVHGLGDKAARDWDGLIAVLARDHHVVTFDLPGFGRSSKGNELYSPENYAAFLRYLVVEHIRTRPFSLVGHSMGGAIALRYAARYPQDVTALVLVDVPGILHRMAYSKHLGHLGINFLPSLYPAQATT